MTMGSTVEAAPDWATAEPARNATLARAAETIPAPFILMIGFQMFVTIRINKLFRCFLLPPGCVNKKLKVLKSPKREVLKGSVESIRYNSEKVRLARSEEEMVKKRDE